MPRDYFHLADRIVATYKYFDISLPEIERQLGHSTKFRFETEIILDDDGDDVTVPISLYIATAEGSLAWAVAIVLHSERIDGVDWESQYRDAEKNTQAGWHRHIWERTSKSCKQEKKPILGINEEISLHEFLVKCFDLLKILPNRDDYGYAQLSFDQNIAD